MGLFNFWKNKGHSYKDSHDHNESKLRNIKDVKNGEVIIINGYLRNNITKKEYAQILYVTVLNNNTEDKKIYYAILWDNGKKETVLREYDSFELRDFKTLNPVGGITMPKTKNIIEKLDDILTECTDKEDFETAAIIRDAILKIK